MEPKMIFPKGSEWRKWDLHIHSPLSILHNNYPKLSNGEPDWDKFIEKLESLDVAVIGITDYFTIEGYKKILEFRENNKLQKIAAILPNIEFRLNSVISSKKDGKNPRRLNFHVIFSDEVNYRDIEEHFLHDLHFYYEGNPQDKDESRKLKLSNLEALGNQLISQHAPFKGRNPLELGATCAVVSHEEITTILSQDSRFKGKYLILFPEELYSLIDWDGQDHHIRKGILQKSDMIFTSSQNTIHWCLGKSPYQEGEKKFIEEFKTLKPCIHGSDAHCLEEIASPCAKRGDSSHKCGEPASECDMRYCWIKADPTFEGLKQLLYEPEERVAIQEEDPTPSRSNLTITKVNIQKSSINKELSIDGTELDLNIGLVAVAGGRGAGKTAFVDLIANCFQDRVNTSDENSFVKRISDQKPDLNVELSFKNNTTFTKKIKDDSYFQEGEVSYIAQGELERYIGEGSDLDKYVNSLIFQNPKIINSLQKYEYSRTESRLREIEAETQKKSNLIERLEQETKSDVIQKVEIKRKQLQATLKEIIQRISELERKLSGDKVEIAKEKQNQITALKSKRDLIVELKEQIKLAVSFIDEEIAGFNTIIKTINKLLTLLEIPEKFPTIIYNECTKLQVKSDHIEAEIKKVIEEIGKIQKEIEQFESGIQDHASLLNKKKDTETSLEKIKEIQKDLESKEQKLTVEEENRKQLLKELINTVLVLKNKYDEAISLFSSQKAKILSDLEFIAEINFNSEKMLCNAEDVIDNRRVFVRDQGGTWAFKKLVGLYEQVASGATAKVDELINEVERLNRELKTKIKTSSAVGIGDFYKFLYRNYLYVLPVVKYKNTRVNKLSLGQKAAVLIKIYLAEGDKPIIIDSHDDHLDNEFIMEELMGSIREAKKYRQVILVSNNGNIVINSDAEQVVLAERNDDGKISYIAGSIENPEIRDRAIKVLEGGPEAFRKRQQKYRIPAL
jgi:hypothetical protein